VTSNVVPNAVLSAISGLQDPATSGLGDGMFGSIFFTTACCFREIHCCTPSIPNCKSFQESWRVKTSQV